MKKFIGLLTLGFFITTSMHGMSNSSTPPNDHSYFADPAQLTRFIGEIQTKISAKTSLNEAEWRLVGAALTALSNQEGSKAYHRSWFVNNFLLSKLKCNFATGCFNLLASITILTLYLCQVD